MRISDWSSDVCSSDLAGKEGKFVTSRQIGDRLQRELKTNVALRVEPMSTGDQFRVSGRGLLHLGILLENMRREGYEIAVSRPQVLVKEIDGDLCERSAERRVGKECDSTGRSRG